MPIGITVPFQKGSRGYFEVSDDLLTQVKSNFINLVLTIKGERFNNPTFGCDIHKIIFEQNIENLGDRAQDSIQEAVSKWMPYLQIQETRVDTSTNDKENYKARLYVRYTLLDSPNISDEVLISF